MKLLGLICCFVMIILSVKSSQFSCHKLTVRDATFEYTDPEGNMVNPTAEGTVENGTSAKGVCVPQCIRFPPPSQTQVRQFEETI